MQLQDKNFNGKLEIFTTNRRLLEKLHSIINFKALKYQVSVKLLSKHFFNEVFLKNDVIIMLEPFYGLEADFRSVKPAFSEIKDIEINGNIEFDALPELKLT